VKNKKILKPYPMEHAATEENRAMHTDRIAPVNGTEEKCPLQADVMPQWQAPGTHPPPAQDHQASHLTAAPTHQTKPSHLNPEEMMQHSAVDQPETPPPNRGKRFPSDPPKGLHPSVEAILTLRHERAMTQAEMASALGISQRTLQDWERGRRQPQGPGKALLERVIDQLQVDMK
jgi:DNA-binding transcriptional regulator YiaG